MAADVHHGVASAEPINLGVTGRGCHRCAAQELGDDPMSASAARHVSAREVDREVDRPSAFADRFDVAPPPGFCLQRLKIESGAPLKLEPFQKRLLADYFDGVTETLILIPKKNGKTTLLAAWW